MTMDITEEIMKNPDLVHLMVKIVDTKIDILMINETTVRKGNKYTN